MSRDSYKTDKIPLEVIKTEHRTTILEKQLAETRALLRLALKLHELGRLTCEDIKHIREKLNLSH